MNRPTRFILWLVAFTLIALPAVWAAGQKSKAGKQAANTYNGTVQNDKGQPVSGAEITVTQMEPYKMDFRVIRSLKTGANGKFKFEAPATADKADPVYYFAMVAKPGLAWQSVHFSPEPMPAKPVTVKLGEATVLAGQVVNRKGEPVGGAWVYPLIMIGSRQSGQMIMVPRGLEKYAARTDAQGRFRFMQIPAGSKVGMTVDHPDYARLTINPEMEGGQGFAAGREDVRLELDPPGRVQGLVVDETTSRPLAGIRLHLSGRNYIPWGNWVVTAADGRFTFNQLASGEYGLQPMLTPEQAKTGLIYPQRQFKLETGQSLEGINLTWIAGTALRGRVIDSATGKPVANANANAYQRPSTGGQSNWNGQAKCDTQGCFELRVPPGKLNLGAYAQDYFPDQTKGPQMLDVKAGGALPEVTLYLKTNPPLRVSGVVLDPQGQPAADALVSSGEWNPVTSRSDAHGRFSLSVTRQPYGRSESLSVSALRADKNQVGFAPIADNVKDEVKLTIRLQAAGAVVGRIVEENKKPLPGAKVTLFRRINTGGGGFSMRPLGEPVLTDAQGKFRLSGLSDGELFVIKCEAEAHGCFSDYDLKGQSGQTIDKGDIILPGATAFVDLTVVDQSGQPVEGVNVYAYGEKQPEAHQMQMTDKDGKLRLGPLVAGDLRMQGNKDGYSHVQSQVQLVAGQTVKLDLEMARESGESARLAAGAPAPALGPVTWFKDKGDLAAFKDRAVALVFFAPGNRPSLVALGKLSALGRESGGKLAVVAVCDASVSSAELSALWSRKGFGFAGGLVANDKKEGWASPAFRAYEVRALPSIVLIGPDGRIRQNEVSLNKLEPAVREVVRGIK